MLTLKDFYEVYDQHQDEYFTQVKEFSIGHKYFDFNSRTAILGVINLSIDSWWKHSICYIPEQTIQRAKVLHAQGADIIDLGVEATSKNTARVDELEQQSQLLPILRTLSNQKILTSVETYYPEVASACLKAGANVINYTGHEYSEQMYDVVAEHDAAIIICYVPGKHAREIEFDPNQTQDLISLIYDFLAEEVEKATKRGVTKIMLDPAVGIAYANFYYQHQSKSNRFSDQLKILLGSFRLKKLGFPVFNATPSAMEIFGEELRSAQVFSSVFAALGGSNVIRTHETAKVKAVLDTLRLL
ncbi:MAG: dihydropteroate synthase [Cyanothece sp. SIO2G6]|nr:dihydropteroate synthase [Cyanothece sp. SIO2G6]